MSRSSSPILAIVIASVLLVLGVIFFWDGDAVISNSDFEGTPSGVNSEAYETGETGESRSGAGVRMEIRSLIDRLSGDLLEPVWLRISRPGEESLELDSLPIVLPEVVRDAVVTIEVGLVEGDDAAVLARVTPGEVIEDGGVVLVDYYSGVRGTLSTLVEVDAGVSASLVLWPIEGQDILGIFSEKFTRGGQVLDPVRMAPALLDSAFQDASIASLRSQVSVNPDGTFLILSPRRGLHRIHAWAPGCRSFGDLVTLERGKWLDLPIALPGGLLVVGTVRSPDGAPVPNVGVKLKAGADEQAAHFSPFETSVRGFGFGAVGSEHGMWMTLSKTVQTNDSGEYSLIIPAGDRVIAICVFEDLYAEAKIESIELLSVNEVRVDLQLERFGVVDPMSEAQFPIELRVQDFGPLEGARVRVSPVGDAKWQRSFPELTTGPGGKFIAPWIVEGANYAGLVFHDSLKGPKMVRFSGGEEVIVLPSDSKKGD